MLKIKPIVCCLYRTKTLSGADQPEMELQSKACHDFAGSRGWDISKEFWQVEAPNDDVALYTDDALVELRVDAGLKSVDILLVCDLDRLGRTPYESPFAAAYFDGKGIEVWTVKDGHIDFTGFWDFFSQWTK